MNNFQQVALFEHRFWLQVLGDHARFIRDALSPIEKDEVEITKQYIDIFDQLLESARQDISGDPLLQLTESSFDQAKDIREFKLHLIRKHLVGDIIIGLPPTFLNHMVNEVEEYLRILPYLVKGEIPPISHPLHHHLVWLLDAAGHADAITGELDMVEKKLSKKSEEFTESFEDFYIKAVELAGYLRANVDKFPALHRFNNQVELEIELFKVFLRELEELEMNNKLLGTFSELMADHMAREECYYLMKLAEASETTMPTCDPTAPRNE
ncbi:DUF2935 domain-containing protein [Alkalihalobacterium alkalinitrilicum]|uniref:DUF2935 domain-containing protein n=1 Tax=Alkalihalobacterium alkalinitrilicum TaxID=427920 RepID=UPI000995D2DA|nr:DUF2935 domain-containing protein [Alkalihalobacterium alkalinitrilicum]